MNLPFIASVPARAAALVVRLYRITLSPLLPPACRFEPTCSAYAEGALAAHGLLKGARLAARRIFRCHPYETGGFDPVPERRES